MFVQFHLHRGLAAKVAIIAAAFTLAGCAEMISREDFTARTKDKGEQQVRKDIGKPAEIDSSAADSVKWVYVERTFNIENGNRFDKKAIVVFSRAVPDGTLKVRDVSFE